MGSEMCIRDRYQRYVAPDRAQAHYVAVGRIIIAGLLVVGYLLSVGTYDFLVVLVTLSGAGALQLMPAILGVCMPGRRSLSGAGVLTGILVGLLALYVTLVLIPHPLGMHGGVWSLLVNAAVAIGVSCAEKRTQRIHPVTPLTRRYQIRRLFFAAFRVAL